MKHIAIEMRQHFKDEKSDLDFLQNDYESAGQLVEKTIKKVGALANSPAGRMTCYMCGIVLLFLIVLYFL